MTREHEKQASRDADARALRSGEKTHADLWRENSFIPPRSMKVDFLHLRRAPRDDETGAPR